MSSLPQICHLMEPHHGINSKIALIYFILLYQAVRQLKVVKKSLPLFFFFFRSILRLKNTSAQMS